MNDRQREIEPHESRSRQDYATSSLPPGQQLVARDKWPQVGEKAAAKSSRPWSLTVTGCVGTESTWLLAELRGLPQTQMTIDIHCVTRWSKRGNRFAGVALSELLAIAEPNEDARFISFVARSDAKHSTSLDLATALGQQTLVALDYQGQPLPPDHGGPIRNIVPGRYFYKSVKWLERIEVLAEFSGLRFERCGLSQG